MSSATPARAAAYDCPSAQPDMANARPIGLISGTPGEVRIAFFKKDALEHFDWRARFNTPEATHVLRFGASCEEHRCGHFNGSTCSLGQRVNAQLEAVVDALPSCLIRPACRWHAEQEPAVCLKCPQVATMVPTTQQALAAVATGMSDPCLP